jgi:TolA-binding protein
MSEDVKKKELSGILFWVLIALIIVIPLVYFVFRNHNDKINVVSSEKFETVFENLKEFDELNDVSKVEEKANLLKELDGIIESYPKTVSAKRALFYKGYVCYFANDFENAVVYFGQFLSQNKTDYLAPKANYFLAFSMIEQDKDDEAVKYLDTIINQLNDKYYAPLALVKKAELLSDKGNKEEALKCYQKIIDEYSWSPQKEIAQLKKVMLENEVSF